MKKLIRILCTIVYSIFYFVAILPITLLIVFITGTVLWASEDDITYKQELKETYLSWSYFPKPTKLFEKNEDEFRW